ncbi:putative nucleotidyltransferase with HDIG domain [Desulfobaculum xiamenense]|uniref:Putative nucleotidyltransferase with HDIG domain n=1 Tax=Desulfobaculum xiamenense TaxID=995050 RepID=A0A846QJR3_9BACT|nr:putative nucleotidyltransferase with HDIG domain [Desulfobaculum xiamenense]
METQYVVTVDQLVEGLFVRLDRKIGSGFAKRQSFKIAGTDDIEAIRRAGITQVVCILEKSDRMPLPSPDAAQQVPPADSPDAPTAEQERTPVSAELLGLRRETVERNRERRRAYQHCERRYEKTMSSVVTILRRASARSGEAAAEAAQVVGALVDTFLDQRDTVLTLMGAKPSEETRNYHALNVTVLALMVGKDLGLRPEAMQALGLGALFHDIGKGRMPMHVVSGKSGTSMNAAIARYRKEHPVLGARLVDDFANFPAAAVKVVLQHHESMDGSGYPEGLSGQSISPLARVVAVVNAFEHLINDREATPLTPHDALRSLYARQRNTLDQRILSLFIRNMGVYPPGTIVELSNGQQGMVISSTPAHAARPTVLMHHPMVPRAEALMVDLVIEKDLEITSTLRPEELSREVFAYLSPSAHINYYAETAQGAS